LKPKGPALGQPLQSAIDAGVDFYFFVFFVFFTIVSSF